ncbi:MAG: META domain-containing protein [Candidatus Promineifilaceae bacterium]|nr:META domain-containing protein [Candidatus Promineifilaceae bacterium]
MNKQIFRYLVVTLSLILVGCSQTGEIVPELVVGATPAVEVIEIPEESQANEAEETRSEPVQTEEELAGPEVFVPIAVEDFGITTLVPADWPAIEGDPLLKNAWGPGEYRFVAFHSVPGDDVLSAMAQLLGVSEEELLASPSEGEFWEERIGDYDWAMYTVDNPDIGLGQSVSMTVQDNIVYIVSLFVELDYRQVVLDAVLENFSISSEVAVDGVDIIEESTPEVSEEETTEAPEGTQPELLDTLWNLSGIADGNGELQDVIASVQVTAQFSDNERVAGSAGCNEYVSNYALDGDVMTITVPAMTRKNCDDPEDIMLQETNFVSNLTAVAFYQFDGQDLQLLDSEKNAILIFDVP